MKFSKKILFAQEGAPMPAPEEQGAPMGPEGVPAPEEGAPAPGPQGGDQLQQLAGQLVDMLMQQIGDPNVVMQVLQMAAEMIGQAAQQQQPAYQKKGGRLVRVRY